MVVNQPLPVTAEVLVSPSTPPLVKTRVLGPLPEALTATDPPVPMVKELMVVWAWVGAVRAEAAATTLSPAVMAPTYSVVANGAMPLAS